MHHHTSLRISRHLSSIISATLLGEILFSGESAAPPPSPPHVTSITSNSNNFKSRCPLRMIPSGIDFGLGWHPEHPEHPEHLDVSLCHPDAHQEISRASGASVKPKKKNAGDSQDARDAQGCSGMLREAQGGSGPRFPASNRSPLGWKAKIQLWMDGRGWRILKASESI